MLISDKCEQQLIVVVLLKFVEAKVTNAEDRTDGEVARSLNGYI